MEVSEFKNIVLDYTRRIAESINCIFSPVSEKYGLTMMQTRILMELNQCKPHTIGSLADSICAAGANISAMCKKLEALGLLERVRNRDDERVVQVVLTDRGKEIVMDIEKTCNDKIFQHLSTVTEEHLDDIILGLQRLNDILQKISKIDK